MMLQTRKMSLGDSLVAGTALTHDLTLVTRNIEDFKWVPDLKLLNPFEGRVLDQSPMTKA